jgi:hypothetical protein
MAMALLISSRLVFNTGNDPGKEPIAIVLLVILFSLLLRSIYIIVKKRREGKSFLITGYLFNNLDVETRKEVGEFLTSNRSFEVERKAACSQVQQILSERFSHHKQLELLQQSCPMH